MDKPWSGRSVRFPESVAIRSRYAMGMATITTLLWDEQNLAHVALHSVTQTEVEEVVFAADSHPFDLDNPERPGRIVVFGTTGARRLAVFLDTPTAAGAAYVLTARPMTAKERRTYLPEEEPE